MPTKRLKLFINSVVTYFNDFCKGAIISCELFSKMGIIKWINTDEVQTIRFIYNILIMARLIRLNQHIP